MGCSSLLYQKELIPNWQVTYTGKITVLNFNCIRKRRGRKSRKH